MKKCPNCNHELPDSANKCKYCDYKFNQASYRDTITIPDEISKRSITDESQVLKKTKKCAYCAMDIPIDASICPYCRKSTNRLTATGESMMDSGKKMTTFVISLIVIIIIVFCLISVFK